MAMMERSAMRETIMNRWMELHRDERGLNTAELLGNAALAIIALLAIWAALEAAGVNIIGWIEDQLIGS
jgi:hypothetical protein